MNGLLSFSWSPQEVFTEMEETYGEAEEMNVCDNLGDHLVGNVYVKVADGGRWGTTAVFRSPRDDPCVTPLVVTSACCACSHVHMQFRREEDAEKAVMGLNNRWFNGQPIHAELSPVTDFREACCRQYEMGSVFHHSHPRHCHSDIYLMVIK